MLVPIHNPGLSGTLTTKFANVVVNTGGYYSKNLEHMGITVNKNYWGEYDLTSISNTDNKIMFYAVCHNDSNSNYCGPDNWRYMTDFAMAHI